jgi:hypothetical protein
MKTKRQVEKRLIAVMALQDNYESEEYQLRTQILRLNGRCFRCEKHGGLSPGKSAAMTPQCLKASHE